MNIPARDYRLAVLSRQITEALDEGDYFRLAHLKQARYRILMEKRG
jgi:hypothetical protein